MGRRPASSASAQTTDIGLRKGVWTVEEDIRLMAYVTKFGCWNWRQLPKFAGLARCGKSCRLRWLNYLNPEIKRGNYTKEEEDTIIRMHESIGNKWSLIAAQLPGRTDNEIKNHWHCKLKKMLKRTPSFKNSTEAVSSSLANQASTYNDINANKVLMDQQDPNAILTDDWSINFSLQEHKKQSDHSSSSSSTEETYPDFNGILSNDPFVVDSDNAYNYVDPDDDYYHYAESLAAAADYGYGGLFSFPSLSAEPLTEEDDFLLPLWCA